MLRFVKWAILVSLAIVAALALLAYLLLRTLPSEETLAKMRDCLQEALATRMGHLETDISGC